MRILIITYICLVFLACRGKQAEVIILELQGTTLGNPDVIRVREDAVVDIPYSEYIDAQSVKVIPLETKDESLLAEVTKIIVRDSLVYILDEKQHAVFVFQEDGKYVNKVDRFGRGPGEYPLLTDFCVEDGWIGMLNFDCLFFYSFDYPDSVRIVRMDTTGASGIEMYADRDHFYFRPSDVRTIKGSVITCDKQMKVKSVAAEPKYVQLTGVWAQPSFIPIEDKLFYHQKYNDTIYQITDSTLLAGFIFDGGNKKVSDSELQAHLWERLPWPGEGLYSFGHIFYADSVLSFLVDGKNNQYQGHYSLRSKKVQLIAAENRKDDIFHLKLKWLPMASTTDGYFYGVIRASQLAWLNVTPPKNSPLAMLKEESNPVLIKYRLRKF